MIQVYTQWADNKTGQIANGIMSKCAVEKILHLPMNNMSWTSVSLIVNGCHLPMMAYSHEIQIHKFARWRVRRQ